MSRDKRIRLVSLSFYYKQMHEKAIIPPVYPTSKYHLCGYGCCHRTCLLSKNHCIILRSHTAASVSMILHRTRSIVYSPLIVKRAACQCMSSAPHGATLQRLKATQFLKNKHCSCYIHWRNMSPSSMVLVCNFVGFGKLVSSVTQCCSYTHICQQDQLIVLIKKQNQP